MSEAERGAAVRKVATTNVADGLDKRWRWPGTLSGGADGPMYVTASHIQDTNWFKGTAPSAISAQLFSFSRAK